MLFQPLCLSLVALGLLSSCGLFSHSHHHGHHQAQETGESGSTGSHDHLITAEDIQMAMTLGPANSSVDLHFIDAMILRHQGSLTLAELAVAHSEQAEWVTWAQGILETYPDTIEQLRQWRGEWYAGIVSDWPQMWHESMGHTMFMSEGVIAALRSDVDLDPAAEIFEQNLRDIVIGHYRGTGEIAAAALDKSQREAVQTMASGILARSEQIQAWGNE